MPYDQGMSAPLHDIMGNINRVLNSEAIKAPRPSKMHAGAAILDWFRAMAADGRPRLSAGIDGFLGLPIIPDADLDDGQWRCFDQYGQVLREGRVGEPGESIFYVAGKGFYAWKADVS